MAGGKETQRQKMIGMMYLVLTALLALNVSKEIINAFVTQDDQLLATNNNLVRSINGLLGKFAMYQLNPSKQELYKKWEPKVQRVKQLSNELDDYLLHNKNQLLNESEQISSWFIKDPITQLTSWQPLHTISNKEDYDIATRLFGGERLSAGYKKGAEIRNKLLKLRDDLILEMGTFTERGKSFKINRKDVFSLQALETSLANQKHPEKEKILSIYSILSQPEKLKNHGEDDDWQLVKFDHQPIVGAIGVFTELRNQVRIAEQKALELIFSKLDGQIIQINKIEPQVIANTRYINMGDTIGVRVGIVAYDSNATYPIKYIVGGNEITKSTSKFTVKGSSVGEQSISGVLSVEMADGKKDLPWNFDYTVGKPQGTISLPEYDVLYGNGYENKIEGTASGFPPDQVQVKCSGCNSFNKSGSLYIAKANAGREVTIKVQAPGLNYSKKYKVLSMFKPEASFRGNTTSIRLTQVPSNGAGSLTLSAPKSSPLKIRYEVVSYTVSVNGKDKQNRGKSFNSGVKNLIRTIKQGDRLTFSNISYKLPGSNSILHLGSSLSLKVKR